jgi:DNA-binding response OmpR family regulator
VKVLIVEDGFEYCDELVRTLESNHCQVELRSNSIGILQAAEQQSYDCVLIDWSGQNHYGFAVIRAIRNRDEQMKRHTHIVILPKVSESYALNYAVQYGADEALVLGDDLDSFQADLHIILNRLRKNRDTP